MPKAKSEYEVESLFIQRLMQIGYEYVELDQYDDVLQNFRTQLEKLNADKLIEKKGKPELSDAEFSRVLIYVEDKSVYESAKILRDKYILNLDNEETVYLDFFSPNTDRNSYQVAHQITMDPEHKDDVSYNNRYDVTLLINGLPLIQIELKRPGVEINEAINQINRYRKFSFKGLFRFIQIFVVSNSVQTKYFCNENERSNGKYAPILKSLVFFWTDEKNRRINKLDEFTSDFLSRQQITEMIDQYMIIKTTEPVLMVMRPYQIYAVKAAKKRVLESNQNGYVFACTGSGKTLTSFKLAQLLRDEPRIDKVIFLIDRKDLDDQTVEEYNSFEKDCVDNSDSTKVLIRQMKDLSRKMIVTTIQKMSNAVTNPRYASVMDQYHEKKVVFIIDECHRSQFGTMRAEIEKHFHNANYIGFTGTPIFEANKGANGRTTADIFGNGYESGGRGLPACLHQYMIKDAIADGNVLRFSVEYQRTIFAKNGEAAGLDPDKIDDPEYCKQNKIDLDSLYHNEERIQKVAADIFEHHAQHTHPQGTDVYTSLFAVDSIKTLAKYYDAFQELNQKREKKDRYRIAAIFTYQANENMDEGADEHSQELLERCMNDYNEMYGTSFAIDSFDAYRKDITKRMKQKDLPQIDILLVVNMFLTGFDAKPCNTLYLDKNLIWHTLVQAYSRTNRVDKPTKQFGQIVSYRNIKKWQDDALRLFSGDGNPDEYLLQSYEYYVQKWINQEAILRRAAETPDDAGNLQNEEEIRNFILAFRTMVSTLATLKTFSKFEWEDLAVVLDEDEYEAYKSWYLYYRDQTIDPNPKVKVPLDVDFDVELVRTDRINVVYILNLLKEAKKGQPTEEEKNKDVDLILREIERSDNDSLRARKDILERFIRERFYNLPDHVDIQEAFTEFEKESLQEELEDFAESLGIQVQDVKDVYIEYTFSGKISDEAIRKKLSAYKMGLLKITKATRQMHDFIVRTSKRYEAEGE
ncbi:MAG: type I restriction endonuclease subunit R [Eubacterium sp.]|jgi:type I restriction enzyme R subunit|nr:type I restriction endonuclease subunit R [Eubacterium sp.]MCH4078608.1 type I restriction endonuclease subunit R [Eubacterium sp.]MCH4109749.1 type I restriction endonuclease subunit R [Eubacterium sp.]MCI1306957.1 type I restriction endonuclease subunit R [Eubacterium sp.]MCI1456525.1 type I restriction endonuclease subunit R [Eubacterium sp.]